MTDGTVMDVRRPCPNWQHHRQIKRWLGNLDNHGHICEHRAVLVIENKQDPCKTRIICEDFTEDILIEVSAAVAVWAGYIK